MEPLHISDKPSVVVAGKSIEEWIAKWEFAKDAFTEVQYELRKHIGIFAIRLGDETVYIGAALQKNNVGFRAGLARVRLPDQSNNNTGGIKFIRKSKKEYEAYIIKLTEENLSKEEIADLKWALVDFYKPRHNSSRDHLIAKRKASYRARALAANGDTQ